jgi:GTP:adenosylcobinamide-phosphate guanylyltransferase
VNAVVMAAGDGRRLRPITERWPKPVLPIDGRPVVATLVRALRGAGCDSITVVTGHLAAQVEALLGDGSGFGVEIGYVRQPRPEGSADAVRRALSGGAEAPALVTGADHVFAAGTLELFVQTWSGLPGAIAARRGTPSLDPRLAGAFGDPGELTGVPLWGIGGELVPFLEDLPGPPYELAEAFGRALDAGLEVRGVVVPGTRDLTHPVDLIVENFPYLNR